MACCACVNILCVLKKSMLHKKQAVDAVITLCTTCPLNSPASFFITFTVFYFLCTSTPSLPPSISLSLPLLLRAVEDMCQCATSMAPRAFSFVCVLWGCDSAWCGLDSVTGHSVCV